MNWLCRLLKCRDRDLEKLYQAWLDRYRDELMRQVDHSEELLREREAKAAEIKRLKELLLRANRALQHTTEFDPVRMDPECDSDHLIIEIKNALSTEVQE